MHMAHDGERTLQEIADVFEITRERVRQLLTSWRRVVTLASGEEAFQGNEGALFNILKQENYRKILTEYYECQIKTSASSC